MLTRLRAANCLERIASDSRPGSVERRQGQVRALAAYVSICVRQPDIFEAAFRSSVLMSVLASETEQDLREIPLLHASLGQLERSWDRNIDLHDSRSATLDGRDRRKLKKRLAQAARRETRATQHRLRPMWTIWHENRLRHLFELTGRERRQMRKALAMSRLAQRARASHRMRPADAAVAQAWWCIWVYWRYVAGRSELTGLAGPLQRRMLLRAAPARRRADQGTPAAPAVALAPAESCQQGGRSAPRRLRARRGPGPRVAPRVQPSALPPGGPSHLPRRDHDPLPAGADRGGLDPPCLGPGDDIRQRRGGRRDVPEHQPL